MNALVVVSISYFILLAIILMFNYGAHTYDRSIDPYLNEGKREKEKEFIPKV